MTQPEFAKEFNTINNMLKTCVNAFRAHLNYTNNRNSICHIFSGTCQQTLSVPSRALACGSSSKKSKIYT